MGRTGVPAGPKGAGLLPDRRRADRRAVALPDVGSADVGNILWVCGGRESRAGAALSHGLGAGGAEISVRDPRPAPILPAALVRVATDKQGPTPGNGLRAAARDPCDEGAPFLPGRDGAREVAVGGRRKAADQAGFRLTAAVLPRSVASS